jgi:thiol-disulfide isomerase/thioredoxin
MHRHRTHIVTTVFALAVLVIVSSGMLGCRRDPDPPTLQIVDKAGFAEVLAKHRGRVVLVDFWATWCEPCVELFPHTVELHRRLADRGLVVISMSLDDPDNEQAVQKFLIEQGATFENYLSQYGTGSESSEAFDLTGVPHLKLYDREGRLHKTFPAPGQSIDPSEIDRAVEELL